MAGNVVTLDKEQLIEVLDDIARQNLPRWLQEIKDDEKLPVSPAERKMSYEEFLEWANEDTLAEWVNGDIVMSSPASLPHQRLEVFLTSILQIFVEHYDLGIVLNAPFQMKLENGREPDVLYIAKTHVDRLHKTYLDGPADLAVEIISPESLERDRGTKFAEYETGGVPEFWLIDPIREQAEFYQLNKKGQYTIAFSGETGVYHSNELPGFWLRVEWLWQNPLPDVARTVWEIIGIEGLRQLLTELEQQGPRFSDHE